MLFQDPSQNPQWLDKIAGNVRDPSWWFTAVFIAIVASLLAAYVKELLGALLSRLSSRFKVWWQKKRFRSAKTSIAIACDTFLLLFLMLRVTTYLTGLGILTILCGIIALIISMSPGTAATFKYLQIAMASLATVTGYMVGKEAFMVVRVGIVNQQMNPNFKKIVRRKLRYRRMRRKRLKGASDSRGIKHSE